MASCDSNTINVISFVQSCRSAKETYADTIRLVKEKFNLVIDKFFVWKHQKEIVKTQMVEDLIVSMKKDGRSYNDIEKSISESYPSEDRNLRNLIYKVWNRYSKNEKSAPIKKRKSVVVAAIVEAKTEAAAPKREEPVIATIRPRRVARKIEARPIEEDALSAPPKTLHNPLKPMPVLERKEQGDGACPCCGGDVIEDESRGQTACRLCGAVLSDRNIDTGPEWRCFDASDEGKIRVGGPLSWALFDTGLSTDFYPYGVDGRGSQLSAKNRANFVRWRKWHNRNKISDSGKRNLSKAFNELDKMCSQLKMSKSYKEEAAMLYRQIRNADLTNGCSINGMITACVYTICRQRKLPYTQDEVLACAPAKSAKELRMCFKRVTDLGVKIPQTEADDYISKYSSMLDIPQAIESGARQLLDVVKKTGIAVGRNPIGVAAASLYIISKIKGLSKNQKDFSDVCEVTDVTIRQRTKEIVVGFKLYEKYPAHFPPDQFLK